MTQTISKRYISCVEESKIPLEGDNTEFVSPTSNSPRCGLLTKKGTKCPAFVWKEGKCYLHWAATQSKEFLRNRAQNAGLSEKPLRVPLRSGKDIQAYLERKSANTDDAQALKGYAAVALAALKILDRLDVEAAARKSAADNGKGFGRMAS